jgi:hypothetical protein
MGRHGAEVNDVSWALASKHIGCSFTCADTEGQDVYLEHLTPGVGLATEQGCSTTEACIVDQDINTTPSLSDRIEEPWNAGCVPQV